MGSYSPPLRRKDSFGLEFNAYPDMKSVGEILFETMGIAIDAIAGIQHLNRNRIVVKMRFNVEFVELMKKYEDKSVEVGSLSAKIINLSKSYTYVSVRNAPFELEDDMIVNILSRYGKVENLRNNKFAVGPFKGLLNGVRTVKMWIRENIPSSCSIRGHNISFMYSGQVRTCFKCGLSGHMVKDCNVDTSERVNIFDEDDFPVFVSSTPVKEPASSETEKLRREDSDKDSTVLNLGSTQDDDDTLQQVQLEDDLDKSQQEALLINLTSEGTANKGSQEEDFVSSGINRQEIQVEVHQENNAEMIDEKMEDKEGKRKREDKQKKVTNDDGSLVLRKKDNEVSADLVKNGTWSARQDDLLGLRMTLKKDSKKKDIVQVKNVVTANSSNSDEELTNMVIPKKSKTS